MQKITILMFTMSTWREWESGIRNRNYFVLQELLKRPEVERIVAVEYLPVGWKRKVRARLNRIWNLEFGIWKNNIYKVSEKLYICSLVNTLSMNLFLRKTLSKFQIPNSKFILWSYFPLYIDYFDAIPAKLKIFDAVDDWSEHPSYVRYKKALKENYREIAKKADIIFTVSEDLRDRLFGGRNNVYWIPNGVKDFKSLKDLKSFHHSPITIGYIGTIQSRIDFDLVKCIAQRHKDKQFVFVGPIWKDAETEKVKSLPNVSFTRRVPYDKVGEYLAGFDATIIPHKINQFTVSMNPMKLHEYLACGLPVISTIDYGKTLVYFAPTEKLFADAVTLALKENNEQLIEQRKKYAQENLWERRVGEMMEKI